MNLKCVCVLSNFFPPVVSGSSVQVSGLCHELSKKGWEVIVITANVVEGSPEYEVLDGIHIYRVPTLRLPQILSFGFKFSWLGFTFFPGNIATINTIIEKHKPQIIHLHNYMFDLALSAVLLRRKYKLPLILTIHTYLRHPDPIINTLFYIIEQLFLKNIVINNTDCIICPDVNVANYVAKEFGNKNTALIPYGINLSEVSEHAGAGFKDKYALQDKKIILSIGHLHAMRNRKDLFLAMPAILNDIPNAVLIVVGDISIPVPDEVRNNQNSIILAGPLQHSDVSSLLGMADIEAHWLNQYEPEKTSLGIASLEAMSAGLPVLTAANINTYGNDVLINGENIIIVEPNKPEDLAKIIIQLLQDDQKRISIGIKARQTILTHFSWGSVCQQTINVYDALIHTMKRP